MLLKYVIKNHKSITLKQTNLKMIEITKVQDIETFTCWFVYYYQRRRFDTDWTELVKLWVARQSMTAENAASVWKG